ncbi:Short-chain dehydrogenase [Candidatus Filomicrobium marinum]|uniref:Short-chain dehydrogenase n=2 Tax=Filomicrobium TaxID=119044 RepID=A0A0D6JGS9_9HYPH|nr:MULTISPECIES: SDR family oxidoreductase [Filomicrobium]CFX49744.1 Short-chain dehydrogenase [Candidatus Filomicrobium marinum]CPR20303.1 Short-chain dehydrogenase [Candidatus Filomicrobium marinum]SDP13022.1 NAD(P)-dependent dehydrogenase, short-chain alcohol dehydrogenase family [Filomicrobium insigne]
MAETRVALVTGANRGIGLEIVRQLGRLGVMPIIASRELDKGKRAAEQLASEGLEPAVVQLDVDDPQSIATGVANAKDLFGRIDILVNNAGILIDGPSSGAPTVENVPLSIVQQTFTTNIFGPLLMIQAVLPTMKEIGYGRIVNLSSGLGQLSEMGGGYPAYRMSKAALNTLTRTLASDLGHGDIKVNAMCPGWVKTDMGGPEATRSPEEGAETAVWLATLDDSGPTGGFFRDKKQIAW